MPLHMCYEDIQITNVLGYLGRLLQYDLSGIPAGSHHLCELNRTLVKKEFKNVSFGYF